MFVGLSMDMWGVSLLWMLVNSLSKKFTLKELRVGGNYVWCLAIAVCLCDLEEERGGEGRLLKSSYGGQSTNGREQFIQEELTSLDTMKHVKHSKIVRNY